LLNITSSNIDNLGYYKNFLAVVAGYVLPFSRKRFLEARFNLPGLLPVTYPAAHTDGQSFFWSTAAWRLP
jgi:hypothetical protein